MKAILERVAATAPLKAVRAGDWLDCGNADRQAASHQALLQKRAFTSWRSTRCSARSPRRAATSRSSSTRSTTCGCCRGSWRCSSPRRRLLGGLGGAVVTLEYYGYPSLAEAYVFENVDPASGTDLRPPPRDRRRALHGHHRPLSEGTLEEMLLGKTKKRLDRLAGPSELVRLVKHEGEIRLNGRPVQSLAALWPRIEAEVARLSANAKGSIIHGDLCFSNILYDLRSRVCKLVDPARVLRPHRHHRRRTLRRRQALPLGARPVRLPHQRPVLGEGPTGLSLDLELRTRPDHERIRERFEKVFFGPGGPFDRREVLLMTALLFASMLPLHDDAPKRQLAMYATALRLLHDFFAAEPRAA